MNTAQELLANLKTRGYWTVCIRPTRYATKRVDYGDLFDVVQRSQISTSGWNFPHIDVSGDGFARKETFIEQLTNWDMYHELWRMYESGQFYAVNAFSEDWRDVSRLHPAPDGWAAGTRLNAYHLIRHFVEVIEFTERFAQTAAGDDEILVNIRLMHLQGRHLYLAPHRSFLSSHPFGFDEWSDEIVYRKLESPDPIQLGLELVKKLLVRTGWAPDLAVLKEILRETRR